MRAIGPSTLFMMASAMTDSDECPDSTEAVVYPFPDDMAERGYAVFPSQLESNPLVLFHATHATNLKPILTDGFRIPDPHGILGGLSSISFARHSVDALTHAMACRAVRPGDYCIFVVCFETLRRKGIVENNIDIHDYTLIPPPKIIGYCIVPASYSHR